MRKIKFIGRKQPYTVIGIGRKKCARCGDKAEFQWQCCANGNLWLPVCSRCDIDINILVLRFFKIKNRGHLISSYIKTRAENAEGS